MIFFKLIQDFKLNGKALSKIDTSAKFTIFKVYPVIEQFDALGALVRDIEAQENEANREQTNQENEQPVTETLTCTSNHQPGSLLLMTRAKPSREKKIKIKRNSKPYSEKWPKPFIFDESKLSEPLKMAIKENSPLNDHQMRKISFLVASQMLCYNE